MLIQFLITLWIAQRAGYIAVSKGRRPFLYRLLAFVSVVIGQVLAGIILSAIGIEPRLTGTPETSNIAVETILSWAVFALSAFGYIGLLKNLPATENAIGDSYLNISFPCTECRELVTFRRDQMNQLVTCPRCKQKTIVPQESKPPVLNSAPTSGPT